MRYTYDNSAGNARNSSRPPRHVVWGQNTSDEMGDLWIQMVPVAESDFARLADTSIGKPAGKILRRTRSC